MDVVADNSLEDGEIPDDDDLLLGYVPLKRPDDYGKVSEDEKVQLQYSDDNSDASSASENSDSDEQQSSNTKKSKIKIQPQVCAHSTIKRKKYDIWTPNDVGVLTRSLIHCDVGTWDNMRGVENYIYPVREFSDDETGERKPAIWTRKYRKDGSKIESKTRERKSRSEEGKQGDKGDSGQQERRTRKRRHGERSNATFQPGRRFSDDEEDDKGAPRHIPSLTSTAETGEPELACEITNKLCEPNDDLILNIVQIAGKKKSIALFEHTQSIEADGGMLIMNGTKRRTPGGVFLFLVKHDDDLTEDEKSRIFAESKRNRREQIKAKQRLRSQMLKTEIEMKRAQRDKLCGLMSRAELELEKVQKDQVESEMEECLMNPPPSPVTDAKDNSSDGMNDVTTPPNAVDRVVNSYDEDFLDIDCPADILNDL